MSLKIETKYINYKANPWGWQETNGFNDICLHNTANSASADSEWSYMNQMQTSGHATVHYFVDEKKAIKCMPHEVDAWAVSDGTGKGGNTTDIHIEICRSTSDNATYQKAFANAMELIAIICKDLGWKPDGHIKFHTDYHTKYCPHKSLDDFGGSVEKLRSHVVSEANKKMNNGGKKLDGWKEYSNVYSKANRVARVVNGHKYGMSDQMKVKTAYFPTFAEAVKGKRNDGKKAYCFPKGQLLNEARYAGRENGKRIHATRNDKGESEVFYRYHQ